MRMVALGLACLLIVPAMVAIVARARATGAGASGARALERVWVALPLLGLVVLLVLAAGVET